MLNMYDIYIIVSIKLRYMVVRISFIGHLSVHILGIISCLKFTGNIKIDRWLKPRHR